MVPLPLALISVLSSPAPREVRKGVLRFVEGVLSFEVRRPFQVMHAAMLATGACGQPCRPGRRLRHGRRAAPGVCCFGSGGGLQRWSRYCWSRWQLAWLVCHTELGATELRLQPPSRRPFPARQACLCCWRPAGLCPTNRSWLGWLISGTPTSSSWWWVSWGGEEAGVDRESAWGRVPLWRAWVGPLNHIKVAVYAKAASPCNAALHWPDPCPPSTSLAQLAKKLRAERNAWISAFAFAAWAMLLVTHRVSMSVSGAGVGLGCSQG